MKGEKMRYLLISHGLLSKGALDTAKLILGELPNVEYLSVIIDSTIESTYAEIEKVINNNPNDQWLIITDILGGTPFNAAYRYLSKNKNVCVYAGFNLPILLELFMRNDLQMSEIEEFIKEKVFSSMTVVSKAENAIENEEIYEL